jgi:hypothetical protein
MLAKLIGQVSVVLTIVGGFALDTSVQAGSSEPAAPNGPIARLGTLKRRGFAGPFLFRPDGKLPVVVSGNARSVAAFSHPVMGQRVFEIDTGSSNYNCQYSPDAKRFV